MGKEPTEDFVDEDVFDSATRIPPVELLPRKREGPKAAAIKGGASGMESLENSFLFKSEGGESTYQKAQKAGLIHTAESLQ